MNEGTPYRKRRPKRKVQVLSRLRKSEWEKWPMFKEWQEWSNYRKYRDVETASQAVADLNGRELSFEYKIGETQCPTQNGCENSTVV